METIESANKVIKDGIALLPDDAKGDFKAVASDIFTYEAIAKAYDICRTAEEKAEKEDDSDSYRLRAEQIALLSAYAVQEANRVASTVWRLVPMPEAFEKAYRALPSMKEMADKYNEFTDARKERMDKVMAEHKAISEEEKELDIFKGIINGIPAEESERRYNEYKQQQQSAMAGGR